MYHRKIERLGRDVFMSRFTLEVVLEGMFSTFFLTCTLPGEYSYVSCADTLCVS